MRVASTGLGETELIADITGLKSEGDLLGLHAMARSPSEWHLITYLEPKDIRPVVGAFFRPSILWAIFLSFIFPWKGRKEPENI